MNRYSDVTHEVDRSKRGRSTAAFFDFDGTLIAGFSVASLLKRRVLSGQMPLAEGLDQLLAILNYGLKVSEFPDLLEETAASLKGVWDDDFRELARDVFTKDVSAAIYPESRALVEAHRRKGHRLVLVSSATQYQVELAAKELGFDHVLCTRLEVADGQLTGNVVPPVCYGKGKRRAARDFAKSQGIKLKRSFFYSDGVEDLPLLERVGRPRPTNPDKELREIAERRGWPIRVFRSRGRPGVTELLRTGMVYGGLVGSFVAGLPAWLLNGSKRDLKNVAMSTWGEYGSAAAGLDIRARGEEHLWSHRPAVFVFNHQSSTDALIVTKLLRQDFTGVAKKEVKSHPIVGPVLTALDTVFIDRGDRGKAIEALKPAVESLKNGTSFAIAPEGQRSLGYKLGPFKKGAFHIAMQAGVPIVPVVIQNSSDSCPKSGIIIRPAPIEVTVLPPVRTDDWQPETIDDHVATVRQMFLEELDQAERPAARLRRVK